MSLVTVRNVESVALLVVSVVVDLRVVTALREVLDVSDPNVLLVVVTTRVRCVRRSTVRPLR
jgi:hypothetical protein